MGPNGRCENPGLLLLTPVAGGGAWETVQKDRSLAVEEAVIEARLALPGWGEEAANELSAARCLLGGSRASAGGAARSTRPSRRSPRPHSLPRSLVAQVRLAQAPGRRSPLSPNWLSTEYPGDLYEIFSLLS